MAEVDIALVVIVGVVFLLTVAAIVVLIYTYQHPDEHGRSYFYKLVVLAGLTFAFISILMLPLDVANTADVAKGFVSFPMDLLWMIVYLSEGALIFILIPFLMWFYEEDDKANPIKKFFIAVGWTVLALVIFIVIFIILYVTIGMTQIPVTKLEAPIVAETAPLISACGEDCSRLIYEVNIQPTIIMYFIALVSWFGWFLLIVFGGIGLTALPMDLINDFRTRPKDIKNTKEGKVHYLKMRKILNERAGELITAAKELKEKEETGKVSRRKKNELTARVYDLEKDFDYFTFYQDNKRSPIFYYFRLFLGILALIVSMAWIAHVIAYDFPSPPLHPFLNSFFAVLDTVFPLFGTLAFGIFSFYLLWCVVKGAMKFGIRLLIITIHPLKYKGTLMNAFMFNTGVILLTSFAVLQFCTQSFADYAHVTSIGTIFGQMGRYLKFLKYFYIMNIYIYALFGFAVLSFLFLLCCSGQKKREKDLDKEFQRLRDSKV